MSEFIAARPAPVAVLGWSQGAAIAQEAALESGDHVTRTALLATYGRQSEAPTRLFGRADRRWLVGEEGLALRASTAPMAVATYTTEPDLLDATDLARVVKRTQHPDDATRQPSRRLVPQAAGQRRLHTGSSPAHLGTSCGACRDRSDRARGR